MVAVQSQGKGTRKSVQSICLFIIIFVSHFVIKFVSLVVEGQWTYGLLVGKR